MSPGKNETDLLLCSVRSYFHINDSCREYLSNLLKQEINWDYFLSIASSNKVLPLVHHALRTCSSQIPPRPMASLEFACNIILARNLLLIHELQMLSALFGGKNIPIIAFKGPVLGRLYNHPGLREWVDLDILVQKEDMSAVEKLLLSTGYKHAANPANKSLHDALINQHAYSFFRKKGNVYLDVHWNIVDREDYVNFPVTEVWTQKVNEQVFKVRMDTLDTEKLILTTCIHHGIRNSWNELRLIADLSLIMKMHAMADWKHVLQSTDQMGITRSLLAGASMANYLFDIPLPAEVMKRLSGNTFIGNIRSRAVKHLFRNASESEILIRNQWNRIRLRDRFTTRLVLYASFVRFLAMYILMPKDVDRAMISLPVYLHFLYYFIRPFRLLARQIQHPVIGATSKNKTDRQHI